MGFTIYLALSLSSRSRDGGLQALHTSDKCVRGLAMMGGEGREGCPVCHQLLVKGGLFSGVGTGVLSPVSVLPKPTQSITESLPGAR